DPLQGAGAVAHQLSMLAQLIGVSSQESCHRVFPRTPPPVRYAPRTPGCSSCGGSTVDRGSLLGDGDNYPSPYDGVMPHGTSPSQASLERALSTATIRRALMLPRDRACLLAASQHDVLVALPSLPGGCGRIFLLTREEVISGQWNAEGTSPKQITRKRSEPAQEVRWVS